MVVAKKRDETAKVKRVKKVKKVKNVKKVKKGKGVKGQQAALTEEWLPVMRRMRRVMSSWLQAALTEEWLLPMKAMRRKNEKYDKGVESVGDDKGDPDMCGKREKSAGC